MRPGFVIGNGESRLVLDTQDIERLRRSGPVYACNAAYRDFTPDVLVAMDGPIIKEILDNYSGRLLRRVLAQKEVVLTPGNMRFRDRGWAAGSTAALHLCLLEDVNTVFMLGFDLSGAGGKVNNVYKGTPCYVKTDAPETTYTNWASQFETIFREFQDVTFYRVGGGIIPGGWKKRNVKHVDYNFLKEALDAHSNS
jgi:hypothetical protein